MTATVTPLGQIPIELIKVGERARKDMGDDDLMVESFKEHGQIQAIVVDANMRLLAGERRLRAAKLIGWETIRAESRAGDDKIQRLGVELDENAVRKPFTWAEVAKLEKTIFDMRAKKDPSWSLRKQEDYRDVSKTQVGKRIALAEAIELIPEIGLCETQDEAWKMYKKLEENVVVQQLRNAVPDMVRNAPQWAKDHYIVSDTFAGMEQLMSGTFDFAEVDPPYGIELDRRKSRNVDIGHTGDYHEVDIDQFPRFMKTTIEDVYRLLKPNTFAVVWYGMQWHSEIYEWLCDAGFAVNPVPAMWYKGAAGQTAQPDVALASSYEPFWLARKGTPKMKRQGRSNVFHYASVTPSKKIHSTEKPLDLLSDILDTILFPGSNILVPFLGSGVTLRAAYRSGHTGLGFDLSQEHKSRFLDLVASEFIETPVDETEEIAL